MDQPRVQGDRCQGCGNIWFYLQTDQRLVCCGCAKQSLPVDMAEIISFQDARDRIERREKPTSPMPDTVREVAIDLSLKYLTDMLTAGVNIFHVQIDTVIGVYEIRMSPAGFTPTELPPAS